MPKCDPNCMYEKSHLTPRFDQTGASGLTQEDVNKVSGTLSFSGEDSSQARALAANKPSPVALPTTQLYQPFANEIAKTEKSATVASLNPVFATSLQEQRFPSELSSAAIFNEKASSRQLVPYQSPSVTPLLFSDTAAHQSLNEPFSNLQKVGEFQHAPSSREKVILSSVRNPVDYRQHHPSSEQAATPRDDQFRMSLIPETQAPLQQKLIGPPTTVVRTNSEDAKGVLPSQLHSLQQIGLSVFDIMEDPKQSLPSSSKATLGEEVETFPDRLKHFLGLKATEKSQHPSLYENANHPILFSDNDVAMMEQPSQYVTAASAGTTQSAPFHDSLELDKPQCVAACMPVCNLQCIRRDAVKKMSPNSSQQTSSRVIFAPVQERSYESESMRENKDKRFRAVS
ncbi:unnamed protein product [Strongylus vulgaris]|uniref:Uncharacterized protein n=1 Tax=Strongylus vulgaris TaxID=40348 RepID=A0A3P7KY31_STRVU|nr:unnamed protein product [Strongylus vulgaris]